MNVKEKRRNYGTIVGTLSQIDRIEAVSKAGVPAVRGKLVISANGSEHEVNFYEPKVFGTGNENAKFDTIAKLNMGQTIKITCDLEGNRFPGRDGVIVNTNRLRLGFINDPYETDEPGAHFDFSGFITEELKEVRDEQDNIVSYEIKVAQSRYNPDTGLSIVTFSVDPANNAIVDGIRNSYKLNQTVRINGHMNSTIKTETRKEEALFGEAQVITKQTMTVRYLIDGGLQVSELEVYTQEEINQLVANTQQEDAKVIANSKSKAASGGAASFAAKPTGTDSKAASNLLGL